MPNFVWKGKTRTGAVQEGILLADSRAAAEAVLRRQNIQITNIREKGREIAIMPRLMMAGDLLRGTLRVVPLPISAPDRPAGLILPRDRATPQAGRAFVECLRTHVAEVVTRGLAAITDTDSCGGTSDTTGASRER